MCHLLCRNNCVQKSPNDTNYYVSMPSIELILFCFECNFNETYNNLNHLVLNYFSQVSTDIVLIGIEITKDIEHISFNCFNSKNQKQSIMGKFHFVNQTDDIQTLSCSLNPLIIYPYHQNLILECNHTHACLDIIVWAITQLGENK